MLLVTQAYFCILFKIQKTDFLLRVKVKNYLFVVENVTVELLTAKYEESCERHNTNPIHSVLNQIKNLNPCIERNECLDLKGVYLSNVDWESLEEIFKRVQFKTINVEATGLNDDVSYFLKPYFIITGYLSKVS